MVFISKLPLAWFVKVPAAIANQGEMLDHAVSRHLILFVCPKSSKLIALVSTWDGDIFPQRISSIHVTRSSRIQWMQIVA